MTRGRPDLARGPEFVRHLSGLRLVPDYDLTAVAPGSVCSCATPMIFGFSCTARNQPRNIVLLTMTLRDDALTQGLIKV